jgi:hypothetical protein
MKAFRTLSLLVLLSSLPVLSGCASAKLEPASPSQRVPNKPNAAAADAKKDVRLQVEANAWMADDRVKDEVTAMKVTVINRSSSAVSVDYHSFRLVNESGKEYLPVKPDDIPVRGATRSIGLPADTIITRSSDSAVNAPDRELSEKDKIRIRLSDQALKSGEVPPGERAVGYVYFERVTVKDETITFQGTVQDPKASTPSSVVQLKFKPRQYQ